MWKLCESEKYCRYKSDMGYCVYTGTECAKETANTIEIIKNSPPMVIVNQVELTDECIQKIAEAVAKKLKSSA